MTVISSGTWPIDPTTTSGTELAAYLNEMVDAIQTSQASPSRPPAIQKGGVWTKTLGATDVALMLYDGTTDREIGKVVGGNATFGGTAVSATAPTPATAGQLWVDSSVAGSPVVKVYNGTAWTTLTDPITLDTVNKRVGINQATPTGQLHIGTKDLVVDAAGKVGIGTTTPSNSVSGGGLHVTDRIAVGSGSAGTPALHYDGSTNTGIFFGVDTMGVSTGGSERMTIDASGNVLVGTTNSAPGVGNTTTGVAINPAGGIAYSRSSDASIFLNRNGSDGAVAIFYKDGGSFVGQVSVSATATTYGTASDYRLKEDVQPMANAIDRVKDLKPVNFAWKVDGSRVDGFLAHELQAVVPEAATGTKDAMRDEEYEVTPAILDDDGNEVTPAVMGTRSVPDYQGIDQSKLVPLLTAALQEALGKIDALEANVAKLMKRK